jgi:serine/threonine-protein kinase
VAQRIALFDPALRLGTELAEAADRAGIDLIEVTHVTHPALQRANAIIIAPAVAADLEPDQGQGPPRWIIGDASAAGKIASAAAACGAQGVLLTPVGPDALTALVAGEVPSPEIDLARARSLIAASLIDASTQTTLVGLAESFAAHDCVIWWRNGETMIPENARGFPDDAYRVSVAAGARIAAASRTAVILSSPGRRSVIAEALRTTPTEVAGLVAIVTDTTRRFTPGERSDLRAIAARLTRELSLIAGKRRLAAEGEKLLAGSMLDPLTQALTRIAFDQATTSEVANAQRRNEPLAVGMIDVVGMRRINLSYGHRAGDEVLAQLSAQLRAILRGNDRIGRFGGDELALLLIGADLKQSEMVMRKLVDRLSTSLIKHEEDELQVTVRGAVTLIGPGERSGEAAFARVLSGLRHTKGAEVTVVPPSAPLPELDPVADQSSLSSGTVIGGSYRVLHELSRGAMGVVYRGEDLGLGRPVAIKVLRSDLASDKDLVTHFRAEASLLASLHHENLVQIFSLGEHAGDVYFAMELVEGQPLSDVLRTHNERREWFPIGAIVQIAQQIGDALDAMHALGVVHRDVKPANVVLDRSRDRAVLVDVGAAARAGHNNEAAGTPGFSAPESFFGPSDAPEVDVYGLGATVYCMLTGMPPFGSGSLNQVINRQLQEPLVPPSQRRPAMTPAIDEVLAKALAPNPKKRWSSTSAFAVALARALPRGEGPSIPRTRSAQFGVETPESILVPTAGLTAQAAVNLASSGATGRVRATHFRVASKLISLKLGDSALRNITAQNPTLAAALSPTLSPLAWIELDTFIQLLWALNGVSPGSDLPHQIGRAAITASFTRLFGANPGSLSVEAVLGAAPTFWKRYHDWSELMITVRNRYAEIILDGNPGSAHVCDVLGGELERVTELAGGKAVTVDHQSCRCKGAPTCSFLVAWS